MNDIASNVPATPNGGGKPGNQNAAKHGLHSAVVSKASRQHLRHGLPAPQLPKACRFIDNRVDEMRRELEDAVSEKHGGVDITHADAIATACDAEKGRQYLYSRLRAAEEAGKPQPLPVIATVMQTIAKLSEARSKAIKSLSLDTSDAALPAYNDPLKESTTSPAVEAAESPSGPHRAAHDVKVIPQ